MELKYNEIIRYSNLAAAILNRAEKDAIKSNDDEIREDALKFLETEYSGDLRDLCRLGYQLISGSSSIARVATGYQKLI